MKRAIFTLVFSFSLLPSFSQEKDTILSLGEVEVSAYRSQQPLLGVPASVTVVNADEMSLQPGQTLVPVMNTVPGVRMEERSPGSYRLSIRGSLLRSPFGVRNVKVYIDEFPFTDAGGNTYFNLLEPNSIAGLEIVKGPEASLYGANTGGVVLVQPYEASDTSALDATLAGGSFHMIREGINVQARPDNYHIHLCQGFQRSDGYRDHSAMQRIYAHTSQRWDYNKKNHLRLFALYSDLDYETPGGLTLEQWQNDPRAARPRKGSVPGAAEQQAGVHNETVFSGLAHEWIIGPKVRHVFALTGTHTDFENPFITNYEEREESTLGIRSYIEMKECKDVMLKWKVYLGIEGQQTGSDIANFDNIQGAKGAKQSAAKVKARQHFYFAQGSVELNRKWNMEGALSVNNYQFHYRNKAPVTETAYNIVKLDPQLMPRLALSRLLTKDFTWRASVSRGYSPPSIAEIRPSNNIIYTGLQPEDGWNYETGIRFRMLHERLWIDAVFFYFGLNDAIVRRVNDQDEEYFVNSGGTRQPGIESQVSLWMVRPRKTGIIRALQFTNSFTFHNFSFTDYSNAANDYSGNDMTGIPKYVSVTGLEMRLKGPAFIFIQHNYTSRLPLNDANSEYAPGYNLLQLKSGWKFGKEGKENFQVFAGADNLLDEKYSLGNDLNAFGGRYYNPAPGRNYYAGLRAIF